MYVALHHFADVPVRAYRVKDDGDIWVQFTNRVKISLSCAETEQLIAELTRELNAAKAEARGVAA